MERLKDCNLEHCTPEQVGVKSSAITAFINKINENNLGLHHDPPHVPESELRKPD